MGIPYFLGWSAAFRNESGPLYILVLSSTCSVEDEVEGEFLRREGVRIKRDPYALARRRKKATSVPVMLRLIRPFHGHADVVCLFLAQFGELNAYFLQMEPSDFFIEFLGQAINSRLV